MCLADRDHGGKNVAPGPLIHHHAVGEHAAIPADVLEGAGSLALIVPHPVARVMHNVEFAAGIVGKTMASGLIMRSRPFHCGIVLGDVEINRPGSKGAG